MKWLGDKGEDKASHYLKEHGFEIVDRNWKTAVCEIDIIAKKAGCIYFVEVKARSNNAAGSGLEYITPKKLKQMQYAAEIWLSQHQHNGEVVLSGIAVDDGEHITFIESLTS